MSPLIGVANRVYSPHGLAARGAFFRRLRGDLHSALAPGLPPSPGRSQLRTRLLVPIHAFRCRPVYGAVRAVRHRISAARPSGLPGGELGTTHAGSSGGTGGAGESDGVPRCRGTQVDLSSQSRFAGTITLCEGTAVMVARRTASARDAADAGAGVTDTGGSGGSTAGRRTPARRSGGKAAGSARGEAAGATGGEAAVGARGKGAGGGARGAAGQAGTKGTAKGAAKTVDARATGGAGKTGGASKAVHAKAAGGARKAVDAKAAGGAGKAVDAKAKAGARTTAVKKRSGPGGGGGATGGHGSGRARKSSGGEGAPTTAHRGGRKSTAKKAGAAAAAEQTGATNVVAKKTPGTATAAQQPQQSTAVPRARVAQPGELVVRPGEDPWTAEEVDEARAGLTAEVERLRAELTASEQSLAGLMRDSGDGAGDDQADTGAKNITREHELALAANAREMLTQSRRALERLDAGTYGLCETCGNPIGKARMQAFPRATLCVECKQKQERRY